MAVTETPFSDEASRSAYLAGLDGSFMKLPGDNVLEVSGFFLSPLGMRPRPCHLGKNCVVFCQILEKKIAFSKYHKE